MVVLFPNINCANVNPALPKGITESKNEPLQYIANESANLYDELPSLIPVDVALCTFQSFKVYPLYERVLLQVPDDARAFEASGEYTVISAFLSSDNIFSI